MRDSSRSSYKSNTANLRSGSVTPLSNLRVNGVSRIPSLVLRGAVSQTTGPICHFVKFFVMRDSNLSSFLAHLEQINFSQVLRHKALNPDQCIYCGCQLDKERQTREHIVPRSLVRKSVEKQFAIAFGTINTVLACRACNELKEARSLTEFRELVRSTYRPNRILILSNLKKLLA